MPALIRLAQTQDAPALAAIYAPFCEESIVSFELVAPNADEMALRVGKISEHYPWLVLEDRGQVAGYVYASQHRERAAYQWSVDVTAYTHPEFRRRGVGRALYMSLFQLLRQQGYDTAHAGIALPNPGSVGLHQALGFQLVGVYDGVGYKLGAWRDVAWYRLSLQRERADPQTPLALNQMIETEPAQAALSTGLAYYRR